MKETSKTSQVQIFFIKAYQGLEMYYTNYSKLSGCRFLKETLHSKQQNSCSVNLNAGEKKILNSKCIFLVMWCNQTWKYN